MTAAKRKQDTGSSTHGREAIIARITKEQIRSDIPSFGPGDTIKVFSKIIEGNKERVQAFEGVVIRRHKGTGASASFTVRKISYNIGVERTFLLHSPQIVRIEVISRGKVRRARLYYLRPLRGKATRIKSAGDIGANVSPDNTTSTAKETNGSHGSAVAVNAADDATTDTAVAEA